MTAPLATADLEYSIGSLDETASRIFTRFRCTLILIGAVSAPLHPGCLLFHVMRRAQQHQDLSRGLPLSAATRSWLSERAVFIKNPESWIHGVGPIGNLCAGVEAMRLAPAARERQSFQCTTQHQPGHAYAAFH
jgi:hypothetical protein